MKRPLIKAYISKTLTFITVAILLISCILYKMDYSNYNTKLQLSLGELVVLCLLFQNLLIRKCNYSLIAISLIIAMSISNLIYINTTLMDTIYMSYIPCIVYSVSLFLIILYIFTKTKIKIKKKMADLGGGVIIKKPHIVIETNIMTFNTIINIYSDTITWNFELFNGDPQIPFVSDELEYIDDINCNTVITNYITNGFNFPQ